MQKLTITSLLYAFFFFFFFLVLFSSYPLYFFSYQLMFLIVTGSSNASEEAVQKPHHNYGEWAIPWANFRRTKWRHARCRSTKQCSLQCHHPLVITNLIIIICSCCSVYITTYIYLHIASISLSVSHR